MSGFLISMHGPIKNLKGEMKVVVNGRNLIVTGGNGCGKTTFINEVNSKLIMFFINKSTQSKENLEQAKRNWQHQKTINRQGSDQYQKAVHQIDVIEGEIERIYGGLQLDFSDKEGFSILLNEGKAIVAYFHANRQAAIESATGANKIATVNHSHSGQISQNALGPTFEQHLANLKTRQSFAKTYDNDIKLYESIEKWFNDLERNIAFLMEDESFKLRFDSDDFKFYLTQKDKNPYTFQTLSSGYSSIFNILSDLIMKAETYKVSPSDLHGIVMIDEIDAHLHVSLQRKILPFLTNTYPLIQFIVTTHSPFVISSLDDSVVYDLSSKQQFRDISSFSYESIVEGLLGVPVMSISLEKDIKRLSALINETSIDLEAVSEIVEKLLPHKEKLDDESAIFLLKGMKLLQNKKGVA